MEVMDLFSFSQCYSCVIDLSIGPVSHVSDVRGP